MDDPNARKSSTVDAARRAAALAADMLEAHPQCLSVLRQLIDARRTIPLKSLYSKGGSMSFDRPYSLMERTYQVMVDPVTRNRIADIHGKAITSAGKSLSSSVAWLREHFPGSFNKDEWTLTIPGMAQPIRRHQATFDEALRWCSGFYDMYSHIPPTGTPYDGFIRQGLVLGAPGKYQIVSGETTGHAGFNDGEFAEYVMGQAKVKYDTLPNCHDDALVEMGMACFAIFEMFAYVAAPSSVTLVQSMRSMSGDSPVIPIDFHTFIESRYLDPLSGADDVAHGCTVIGEAGKRKAAKGADAMAREADLTRISFLASGQHTWTSARCLTGVPLRVRFILEAAFTAGTHPRYHQLMLPYILACIACADENEYQDLSKEGPELKRAVLAHVGLGVALQWNHEPARTIGSIRFIETCAKPVRTTDEFLKDVYGDEAYAAVSTSPLHLILAELERLIRVFAATSPALTIDEQMEQLIMRNDISSLIAVLNRPPTVFGWHGHLATIDKQGTGPEAEGKGSVVLWPPALVFMDKILPRVPHMDHPIGKVMAFAKNKSAQTRDVYVSATISRPTAVPGTFKTTKLKVKTKSAIMHAQARLLPLLKAAAGMSGWRSPIMTAYRADRGAKKRFVHMVEIPLQLHILDLQQALKSDMATEENKLMYPSAAKRADKMYSLMDVLGHEGDADPPVLWMADASGADIHARILVGVMMLRAQADPESGIVGSEAHARYLIYHRLYHRTCTQLLPVDDPKGVTGWGCGFILMLLTGRLTGGLDTSDAHSKEFNAIITFAILLIISWNIFSFGCDPRWTEIEYGGVSVMDDVGRTRLREAMAPFVGSELHVPLRRMNNGDDVAAALVRESARAVGVLFTTCYMLFGAVLKPGACASSTGEKEMLKVYAVFGMCLQRCRGFFQTERQGKREIGSLSAILRGLLFTHIRPRPFHVGLSEMTRPPSVAGVKPMWNDESTMATVGNAEPVDPHFYYAAGGYDGTQLYRIVEPKPDDVFQVGDTYIPTVGTVREGLGEEFSLLHMSGTSASTPIRGDAPPSGQIPLHARTAADDAVAALDPGFLSRHGAASAQARVIRNTISTSVLQSAVGSQFKRHFAQTEPVPALNLNRVQCEASSFVATDVLRMRFRTGTQREFSRATAEVEVLHKDVLVAHRSLLSDDGTLKCPVRSCEEGNLFVQLWCGVCVKPIEHSDLKPISFRSGADGQWNADPSKLSDVLRQMKSNRFCYHGGDWNPNVVCDFLICAGARPDQAQHVAQNVRDYLDKFVNVDEMAEYGKSTHELTWSPNIAAQIVHHIGTNTRLTEGETYVLIQYYSNWVRTILYNYAKSAVQASAGNTLLKNSFDFPGSMPFLSRECDT